MWWGNRAWIRKKLNQDCTCRHEINSLLERIKSLEEQRKIKRFGIDSFMLSDSDIRFFSGLLDYKTFLALYNFLKPRSGFQLNYYNGYTTVTKHPSYVVSRGRARNLVDIDELFLTMNRLRLGLPEKDFADRFNTDQTEVSKIFCTWADRMHDCLGQLSFLTDHDNMKKFLPNCFKSEHEDVYLIIDCTELFIEKSSQVIQQSATWSENKGLNTGKDLIAFSPIILPTLFLRCILEAYQVKRFCLKVAFWYWPKEGTDGWLTMYLLSNVSWMIMEQELIHQ